MTSSTATGSSSSSAKETLQKALKESHFRSGKEFKVFSSSQVFTEGYGLPVRSGSHDTNKPFADRTPILSRRTSLKGGTFDKKNLKIAEHSELITLRKTILDNGYLKKEQIKAIKNNTWEYPVLHFIQSHAPEWILKEITIKEKLHNIPAEILETLFSTTWARHFIEIDPLTIFEKLDGSWPIIRNFIQQLDDLKKIKFRDDLTDQLLSLYQHKILKMDFSIQYTLDDLIEIIKNIVAIRDLNIFTAGGLLIQSEIESFSKRALDLLFLQKYSSTFRKLATKYPNIKKVLIRLAKTPLKDPNYAQKMIQMEQMLILCSKDYYTRWILENKVLHLQDLWILTRSGQRTESHIRACKRIYHFYKGILIDAPTQYQKHCQTFRQKLRNDKKLFSLLGDNKIDITDIISNRNHI